MKVITVGRDSANDVVVDDTKVSRVHLQIVQNDEGVCSVVDLGSSNGTFVNGRKITGETRLQPADIIRIGNTILAWSKYINAPVHDSGKSDTDHGETSRTAFSRMRVYIAAGIVLIIVLCGGAGWYSYHNKQKPMVLESQINSVEHERLAAEQEKNRNIIKEQDRRLEKAYKASDENAKRASKEETLRIAAEAKRDKAIEEAKETKTRAKQDSISVIKDAEAKIVANQKVHDAAIKAVKEEAAKQHEADVKQINEAQEQALRNTLELDFIKNVEPQITDNNNCLNIICQHYKISANKNNKERLNCIKSVFENADNQKRQEIIEVCKLAYDFESNLNNLKASTTQQQLLQDLGWLDLLEKMSITDFSGQTVFSFDKKQFRNKFAESSTSKTEKVKVVELLKKAVDKPARPQSDSINVSSNVNATNE